MREQIWFYNLRVGRREAQVAREIHAILSTEPAVLGGCEAIGYHLPRVPGYRLIRDQSKPGRANIMAYVHDKFMIESVRWTDCHETWPRPHGPGRHPARSVLTFRTDGIMMNVHHQPPRQVPNAIPAQQEGNDILTDLMAPWTRPNWPGDRTWAARRIARSRPRFVIMDANRAAMDTGPGPGALARAIKGKVVPVDRIDCMVYRGQLKVIKFTRPDRVAGVELKSDHPHALRVVVEIPDKWGPS